MPRLSDARDGVVLEQKVTGYGGKYLIERSIGKGAFSTVYKAKHWSDGIADQKPTDIALKISNKSHAHFHKDEYNVLKRIRDLNPPCRFLSTLLGKDQFTVQTLDGDFEIRNVIAIELQGPTLLDILTMTANGARCDRQYPLTDQQAREITYQLLVALEALHGMKIIHTDIKPENVMFKQLDVAAELNEKGQLELSDTHVILCDYNTCISFDDPREMRAYQTANYRSPEVFLLTDNWNEKADIWSIGCLNVELYFGCAIFFPAVNDDESEGPAPEDQSIENVALIANLIAPVPVDTFLHSRMKVFKKLSRHKRSGSQDSERKYGDDNEHPIVEIMRKATMKLRADYESAMDRDQHPIVTFRWDFLKQCPVEQRLFAAEMLDVYQETRPSAKEAMMHRYFDGIREKYD